MDAGAIKAGQAYVEITAQDASLRSGLKTAEDKIKAFSTGLSSIGAPLAAVGASITGAMGLVVRTFVNYGSTLNDASERTGIAASKLAELGYAADQTGTNLGAVEGGLKKMAKAITEAAAGGGAAQDAFRQLGLNVAELAALKPEQQFEAIGKRIAAIADPTQRAAAAMAVLGKSGTDLLPMINSADELRERFRRLGFEITDAQVKAADDLGDSWVDVTASMRAASVLIGSQLAPQLSRLTDGIISCIRSVTEFVRAHERAAVVVAGFGVGSLALGTTMLALSRVVGTASSAIKGLSTAITIASGALGISKAGFLGLAAAIAAVGYAAYESKRRVAELQQVAGKDLQAGDKARGAQLSGLGRLGELAGKDRLSTGELDEARGIITELKATYGELGITVDEVGRKLITSAGSIDGAFEAMRGGALTEVDARIAELRANIEALDAEAKSLKNSWGRMLFGPGWIESRGKANVRDRIQAQGELLQLQVRRDAIAKGYDGNAALAPGAPTSRPSFDMGPSDAATQQMDRLKEARARMLDETYQREIALIDLKYERELRELRKHGADKEAIELAFRNKEAELDALFRETKKRERTAEVESAADLALLRTETLESEHQRALEQIEIRYRRSVEIARIEKDQAAEQRAERQRTMELEVEGAKQAARVREAGVQQIQGLQDDILGQLQNTAGQLERLRIARQRELAEAALQGLNIAHLINKKFDMEERLAKLMAVNTRYTSTVTFSSAAAERVAAGTVSLDPKGTFKERDNKLGEMSREANQLLRDIREQLKLLTKKPVEAEWA